MRRRIARFDGQIDLDLEKLIFIDETAVSTKMARRRDGRHAVNDAGRPFLMAIGKRPSSPLLLGDRINGPAFLAYDEQVLALKLRARAISW